MSPVNWKPLAENLASILEGSDDLVSPHWKQAFEEVPRHVFVPRYFQNQGGVPTRWKPLDAADGGDWLNPIYTNATLVTRFAPETAKSADGLLTGVPTSSSTQPSLTARMLEALDVQPGDRVLDGGTGTGYQTALIAHRLESDDQLVTADIDPDVTSEALLNLEAIGITPNVLTVDVRDWTWPPESFDKVIITCALPRITETLRSTVAPGGRLVANLFPPLSGGLAVLDRMPDGNLEGRFQTGGGSFMAARTAAPPPPPPPASGPVDAHGESRVPVTAFDSYHFTFLLASALPGVVLQYGTDDEGHTMRRLVMPDGAWAEGIFVGEQTQFRETGEHGIWDTVEGWWGWFVDHDMPKWDRFGLTVSDEEHRLWYETPRGPLVETSCVSEARN
ncbi:methyltransferase domain-containing protein [Streptomyces asiaticus]|uniref:Protein-L-isoaspartate O-methyltransferase n=1 Tax=Streptomyces rhizosphaericus TaxID=114699 RepID=A0ABN1SHT2_9ACTN